MLDTSARLPCQRTKGEDHTAPAGAATLTNFMVLLVGYLRPGRSSISNK
jgi:hypothetical protein